MDKDLAPRDRRRERVHLPQMDRCRTPVFPEARVRKAERDREAQKPSPFGPRNDCELPRRHLRSSEIEDPGDPAVTKGMNHIRIGHVALRGIYLGPYSTRTFPASGQRCSTFCPGTGRTRAEVSAGRDTLARVRYWIGSRPDAHGLGG